MGFSFLFFSFLSLFFLTMTIITYMRSTKPNIFGFLNQRQQQISPGGSNPISTTTLTTYITPTPKWGDIIFFLLNWTQRMTQQLAAAVWRHNKHFSVPKNILNNEVATTPFVDWIVGLFQGFPTRGPHAAREAILCGPRRQIFSYIFWINMINEMI